MQSVLVAQSMYLGGSRSENTHAVSDAKTSVCRKDKVEACP